MHNLLYQMRQTAAARIAAILKTRHERVQLKEVMPSVRPTANSQSIPGLPVNGAAQTAPEVCGAIYGFGFICQFPKGHSGPCGHPKYDGDERAEFEQWEREAWGV